MIERMGLLFPLTRRFVSSMSSLNSSVSSRPPPKSCEHMVSVSRLPSHKIINLHLVGLPGKHMLVSAANLARGNGTRNSEETGDKWKLYFDIW